MSGEHTHGIPADQPPHGAGWTKPVSPIDTPRPGGLPPARGARDQAIIECAQAIASLARTAERALAQYARLMSENR